MVMVSVVVVVVMMSVVALQRHVPVSPGHGRAMVCHVGAHRKMAVEDSLKQSVKFLAH
jgi:hypothetical protein